MADWIIHNVELRDGLSALALVVSTLSLFISFRTAQGTNAEKAVNPSITLSRCHAEWWLANLKVRNNSHLDIAIEKLSVRLPDFRLGNLAQTKPVIDPNGTMLGIEIGNIDYHLAMPFNMTVASGETKEGKFLLYQPAHSRRTTARISMMYWTQEPKRRWHIIQMKVQTRSGF